MVEHLIVTGYEIGFVKQLVLVPIAKLKALQTPIRSLKVLGFKICTKATFFKNQISEHVTITLLLDQDNRIEQDKTKMACLMQSATISVT